LRACFAMAGLIHSTTRASPAASVFVQRASNAADHIAGFHDAEQTNSRELIEGLRQRGVPRLAVDDDDEAEAA
jgi:ribosome-binding factor A